MEPRVTVIEGRVWSLMRKRKRIGMAPVVPGAGIPVGIGLAIRLIIKIIQTI